MYYYSEHRSTRRDCRFIIAMNIIAIAISLVVYIACNNLLTMLLCLAIAGFSTYSIFDLLTIIDNTYKIRITWKYYHWNIMKGNKKECISFTVDERYIPLN